MRVIFKWQIQREAQIIEKFVASNSQQLFFALLEKLKEAFIVKYRSRSWLSWNLKAFILCQQIVQYVLDIENIDCIPQIIDSSCEIPALRIEYIQVHHLLWLLFRFLLFNWHWRSLKCLSHRDLEFFNRLHFFGFFFCLWLLKRTLFYRCKNIG